MCRRTIGRKGRINPVIVPTTISRFPKSFLGYIRVSTAKQGERGVSLQEQRESISRYAERQSIEISAWFEERETAAKRGRPVFAKMLRLLKSGKAAGVIIHKIDRSARNLRDWADLGELIDQGIDVRFANESLDLQSRGGRLSADIQAVVAADYIRNLREETRKGFYGRLKQGVYPLPAPLGYTNQGAGKPKAPNLATAPLVRKAFELYATAGYNLETLREELAKLGLRNRRGGPVSLNGLSVMLRNPFYIGLIRLRRTGETFPGGHEPIVRKVLFERVQDVLAGKVNARTICHDFLFRKLLACAHCGYSLIGERQKGRVYYRCHTRRCPTTTVREDVVDGAVKAAFTPLRFTDVEERYLVDRLDRLKLNAARDHEDHVAALQLRLAGLDDRLARLTDAYIDGTIEKEIFENRKAGLLIDKRGAEDALASLKADPMAISNRLARFLELARSVQSRYESDPPDEKRELIAIVTSNRQVTGRNVDLTLSPPFREIANRAGNANSGPSRDIPRTLDALVRNLTPWCAENPSVNELS